MYISAFLQNKGNVFPVGVEHHIDDSAAYHIAGLCCSLEALVLLHGISSRIFHFVLGEGHVRIDCIGQFDCVFEDA